MNLADNQGPASSAEAVDAAAVSEERDAASRNALLVGDLARRMLVDLEPDELAPGAVAIFGPGLCLDVCAILDASQDALSLHPENLYVGDRATSPVAAEVEGAAEVIAALLKEGEAGADDLQAGPGSEAAQRLARFFSARSILAAPIAYQGRLRFVFVLAMQQEPRDWESGERLALHEASALLASALTLATQVLASRRATERMALIQRFRGSLSPLFDFDAVLREAAERISAVTIAASVMISRLGTDRALRPLWHLPSVDDAAYACAFPNRRVAPRRVLDELLAVRSPVAVEREWANITADRSSQDQTAILALCPLLIKEQLWGVVEIARRDGARPWADDDLVLLGELCQALSNALWRAELSDRAERAERGWAATLNGVPDGIFLYGGDRRLRRANAAVVKLLGRAPDTLEGSSCCDIGLCGSPGECGVVRSLSSRERVTLEMTSPRTYHALQVTIDPILDADENTIGAIQIVRDLDELRRTEAEIRRQQQFLVNLVESAHDAIFVVDLAGRLVWSNSHLPEMVGTMVSETIGKPHTMFSSQDERHEFEINFLEATTGETRRFEASLFNVRTSEERRAVVTYSPILEDGKVVSVLGVARDVTEEKRVAERSQQADKLRALGQLASGVAHDVNNDLAAILGRVQRLMREDRVSDSIRRDLEVIETAALDSAQTVRRIQNFARQQGAGHLQPVDVNGLVRDAVEITRTRWLDDARSRGLQYTVDCETADLPPVLGDGSQLREVFVNLIINALDAMPRGGALRISTVEVDGEAVVRFADEGTGIPRRIRQQIFEPFFTTKGALGTGMGLAVSYGIITRHNGRIDVDSEVGRGAVFIIALPVTSAPIEEAPAQPTAFVGPLNLLVIDDEVAVREILADMLDEQGHLVTQAENGRSGIEHLAQTPIDVVFTDLSMPEMDGLAVARFVREQYPNIKIVLVTGYGTTVPEPVESGLVDSIMGKPFEFEEIASVLQRLYVTPH